MRNINKMLFWLSGITGSWMSLEAGSLQFATNTQGAITTVVISQDNDDGINTREEVVLNKSGNEWIEFKNSQKEACFKLCTPQYAVFVIGKLTLQIAPTLDLYLEGSYDGNICIDHPNKVVIAKTRTFNVSESFFLNKAILFENQGNLIVDKNWICLLTDVKNSGAITVKQGWQVMSLKTLENNGEFTMQQTDILSPATKITNTGKLNCILDFNGASCEFINHAGEVHIGGNCTLNALNNKSETEPVVEGFKEVKREFFNTGGVLLIQIPDRLEKYTGKLVNVSQVDDWNGYKRKLHYQQSFGVREGRRGSFIVHQDCTLVAPSVLKFCHIFVGKNFEIKASLVLHGMQTLKKVTEFIWCHEDRRGCRHGFHGHPHYHDYWFADTKTDVLPSEILLSHLEVFGTVTGKVETFVNGKADKAQPGVEKATAAALEQHQQKLDAIAQEAGIYPMLVDPEAYVADLAELKTNPGFAMLVKQQERCKAASAASSTMPSRSGSISKKETGGEISLYSE